MLNINGNVYKLCLIDTNILSEMLKNPTREFKQFFELSYPDVCIPCFSIFTILELRKKPALYDEFLIYFSMFPCALLKSHQQLLSDEIESYPDPSNICPALIMSPGIASKQGETLKDILDVTFGLADVANNEAFWNAGKSDVIEGILKLKDNFAPKGKKYSAKEIRLFIEASCYESIARENYEFAKRIIDKKEILSIDSFPSLKMMLFTVFFKFYSDRRKPKQSDTFDLIISSTTPYMDLICTENHQAEVISKIRKHDNFLDQLKVFKLGDFRH